MNIQIYGDHLKVTDALREYVERKIGRIKKYLGGSLEHNVRVNLAVERGAHRAEVRFSLQGVPMRAEASTDDMYASIDLVADKLQHQVQKQKVKLFRRTHDHGQSPIHPPASWSGCVNGGWRVPSSPNA